MARLAAGTGAALLAVLSALLVAAGCAGGRSAEVEERRGDRTGDTTAAAPPQRAAKSRPKSVVAAVVDGDTIELADGRRVRLVQIDAPELDERECYAEESANVLGRLIPPGTNVTLEADPLLDQVDRYGRLLRYVRKGRVNVNVALVRQGAATVWFYGGDRGRYAERLLHAAREARADGRGLWRACPGTRFDPYKTIEPAKATPARTRGGSCAAGYEPCLPALHDLDCGDISDAKKPVRVTGSDPYKLDSDGDGYGCDG